MAEAVLLTVTDFTWLNDGIQSRTCLRDGEERISGDIPIRSTLPGGK